MHPSLGVSKRKMAFFSPFKMISTFALSVWKICVLKIIPRSVSMGFTCYCKSWIVLDYKVFRWFSFFKKAVMPSQTSYNIKGPFWIVNVVVETFGKKKISVTCVYENVSICGVFWYFDYLINELFVNNFHKWWGF